MIMIDHVFSYNILVINYHDHVFSVLLAICAEAHNLLSAMYEFIKLHITAEPGLLY